MISVVIPYFQREAGVLRRSLASVACQQGLACPVEVLVVDDESPAPPEPEVAAVEWPRTVRCRILKQPNAGPGAARNRGLDAIAADTTFVALLDSDDEWTSVHLSRAVAALGQDFDFYFADLFQIDQSVSAFQRAGRIDPSQHPAIAGVGANLHVFSGDLFDQTLRGNVIGTPTVVYRVSRLGHLRFLTELTSAGEDYLFWMSVARSGARVVFSSEVEVRCGRGINVYAGSGWGTPGHLKRLHHDTLFRLTVRKNFELNSEQSHHVRQELKRLRLAFARDLVHRLRHRATIPWHVVLSQFRHDPWSLAGLPGNVLRIALNR